jgi:hypothetical protein
MLGSISPVGEAARNQRWWLTATTYVVASTGGGTLLGALLGGAGAVMVGALAVPVRLGALGVVLVVAAAVDVVTRGAGPPSWHRQVDERWLTTYRGWVYGAGFGAQLGVGVATIVTSAATYATLAAALLAGSWSAGLAVGATFGAARTLPLLATAGVDAADHLHAVTRRVARAEPLAHRLTVGGQGALAAVALVTALSA